MTATCVICGGRRRITLPVRRSVPLVYSGISSLALSEVMSREYPCPECGDTVPQERLFFVTEHRNIDIRTYEGWSKLAQEAAAQAIVNELVRRGFITFHQDQQPPNDVVRIEARLGAVHPSHTVSLEQRISDRQDEIAYKVAEEAMRQIRVWRSFYTGDEGSISKGQAVDAVKEALEKVVGGAKLRELRRRSP